MFSNTIEQLKLSVASIQKQLTEKERENQLLREQSLNTNNQVFLISRLFH